MTVKFENLLARWLRNRKYEVRVKPSNGYIFFSLNHGKLPRDITLLWEDQKLSGAYWNENASFECPAADPSFFNKLDRWLKYLFASRRWT